MKIIKSNLTETALLNLAADLSQAISAGLILFLEGPLGVGKTTFSRGFLRGLGYQGKVKSPTYTLLEPYLLAEQSVFHFDFYRIENVSELQHLGLEEYFFPAAICLIEWPQNAALFLPTPDVTCHIEIITSTLRTLRLQSFSPKGAALLQKL